MRCVIGIGFVKMRGSKFILFLNPEINSLIYSPPMSFYVEATQFIVYGILFSHLKVSVTEKLQYLMDISHD